MPTKVLIPGGALGLEFQEEALWRGVVAGPDIIAIDGGSTDSGPHYLGSGTSKYSRQIIRAQWRLLMRARARAGVPLVVGSAGTCGTDAMVREMLELTRDLAQELSQNLRVVCIFCEQERGMIQRALSAGRITALWPEVPLNSDIIGACTHIVALAGAEHITAALAEGADIIIAGRATDTAAIAALPLMNREHPGAAWHGAKIAECGALCSTNPTSGVLMVEFDKSGFTVRPMAEGARCTPELVAAHMLYENADPTILHEPGGYLDVGGALYRQEDETSVRASGARWHPTDAYTVKLEGARPAGHQAASLVLLREPRYVHNAEAWGMRLEKRLHREIQGQMGLSAGGYRLELRLIGKNATLGALEFLPSQPSEVGVMLLVTASDRETAMGIVRLCNPFLLHYPLTDEEPQATFAFPFSPPEWDRGEIHTFCLNHVLHLADPQSAFRMETEVIAHG